MSSTKGAPGSMSCLKTIFEPSGEKSGSMLLRFEVGIRSVWPEPSLFMTMMWSMPDLLWE